MTARASGRQAGTTSILEALPAEERLILPCLQSVQRALGHISDEAVDAVSEFLNVSRAEVVGVLSYYHDLRSTPPAPVVVALCGAEACQAQGARSLAGDIEREYRADHDVEVRTVYCLGNCALGPAATVNGHPLGRCDTGVLRAAVVRAREGAR